MTNPREDGLRSTFTSTVGGVMTEEAGAVTGELEVLCRPASVGLRVAVRYAGAEEWYTISGGPVRTGDDPRDAMDRILHHLTTPAPVVDGNEMAVTLEGLAEA